MVVKINKLVVLVVMFLLPIVGQLFATGGNTSEENIDSSVEYSDRLSDSNSDTSVVEVAEPEVVIPELTVENVRKELIKLGVENVDIVLRQSILETGWYKCDHCSLMYNNIFGFRWKGKYLKFDDWTKSVEYYKWWQGKLYKGGDYYAFLKKVGYATSKTYLQKLKQLEGTY